VFRLGNQEALSQICPSIYTENVKANKIVDDNSPDYAVRFYLIQNLKKWRLINEFFV
jgi:hypothetical protein